MRQDQFFFRALHKASITDAVEAQRDFCRTYELAPERLKSPTREVYIKGELVSRRRVRK